MSAYITTENISPLTDFLRNSKGHIARLKKTKKPEVLTVHGKAEVVIQEAASYQELLRRVERADLIQSLREAATDLDAGKGISWEKVEKELDERMGA
jgi:hypothetical protein